jgi:hypothetical protein
VAIPVSSISGGLSSGETTIKDRSGVAVELEGAGDPADAAGLSETVGDAHPAKVRRVTVANLDGMRRSCCMADP